MRKKEIEQKEKVLTEKQLKKKKRREQRTLFREILEDIAVVLFVMIIVLILQNYVIVNAQIPSASMEDTIMTGDRIVGNRLAYRDEKPQRGDIVVFKFPDDENQLFIKRVIGLPGEKILIRKGLVYINDSPEPLEEPYLKDAPFGDFGPFFVPEGHYFMLGDNRNFSKDSRVWTNTYVSERKILAKAMFRYWPLTEIGFIE